jgi:tetratricopeptide (TPR) repeat protein
LRPDYLEALVNRGHAFQETGRYRKAVDDYSWAIAAKPDFAAGYHDRAAAFYQLKDYERAWADIRTCRQLGLTPNRELIRRLEADSGRRVECNSHRLRLLTRAAVQILIRAAVYSDGQEFHPNC